MHVGQLLVTAWVVVEGWMLAVVAGCCCWLLLLIPAVDCCCWLLLLVAVAGCCCWLLLLVAAAGCCYWLLLLFAAVDFCCWDTACWRESFWLFPGYPWFAAKTILQAKKSLNIFAEVMKKSGWDNFWDCLRIVSEWGLSYRNMMRGKWKRVSPRGSRLVGGSKRMIFMVSARENQEQVGWLCKAEFAAKTSFETVLEKFRWRDEEFWLRQILRSCSNDFEVRIEFEIYDERKLEESFASGK